jgi:hypothetical protein
MTSTIPHKGSFLNTKFGYMCAYFLGVMAFVFQIIGIVQMEPFSHGDPIPFDEFRIVSYFYYDIFFGLLALFLTFSAASLMVAITRERQGLNTPFGVPLKMIIVVTIVFLIIDNFSRGMHFYVETGDYPVVVVLAIISGALSLVFIPSKSKASE